MQITSASLDKLKALNLNDEEKAMLKMVFFSSHAEDIRDLGASFTDAINKFREGKGDLAGSVLIPAMAISVGYILNSFDVRDGEDMPTGEALRDQVKNTFDNFLNLLIRVHRVMKDDKPSSELH